MVGVLTKTPTPVTIPLDVPTVAWPELLVDHTPPALASLNVTLEPEHKTLVAPLIGAGVWLTVTGVEAIQPVPKV